MKFGRCYGVFEILNVDKMKHCGSSGVQKNENVFKINCKHYKKCQKDLSSVRDIAKTHNTLIT